MTKKDLDRLSSLAEGVYNKIYYDERGNKYIGTPTGRIIRYIAPASTTATTTAVTTSSTTTTTTPSLALDDLTDVTITSPTLGEALVYNGTDWVNQPTSGTGTVTSVQLTAGTGVSLSGTNPITTSGNITVTNTAPDQTVSLTAGSNISVTGTYPNFTIASTASGLKTGTATQVSAGVYTTTIAGVTSYTTGDTYIIKFATVNNGASTLNINSIGAINVFKNTDVPLSSGDIKDNQEITIVYDGTNFQAIGLVQDQLLAYVHNAEGSIITKGQIVYAYQATGNKMSVKLAKANSDATSAKTVGLVYDSSIGIGADGYIIIQGVIEGVNTAAYSAGDTLYLSGTTFGQATNVKPHAPTHLVYVGIVERANAGNGQIYVRCQNGYELDEIHDVDLISTAPVNNDILTYVTGSPNLWKPRSISTILGYTPGQGTVTSVGLTAGAGISLAGTNPVTSSGSITVTNSAPDQVVAISAGTGISTSGTYPSFTITNSSPDQVVSLTAGTGINVTGSYPNFTVINTNTGGSGTVTSITASSPLTGGTISTSGTIGITQSTTTTDGYLSSTDWNTFNNKPNRGFVIAMATAL